MGQLGCFQENTIVCGDAREVLAQMPGESVHLCITSPPYWGLRSYEGTECIFGGDEECEHQWGGDFAPPTKVGKQGMTEDIKWPAIVKMQGKPSGSQFCSLCGAWRGQFGLEPTPEMYVEHTLEFLRAIWRVLRKDGTCWVNIGDSYAGSGVHAEYHANPGLSKAGKRHGAIATPVSSGLKPKDLVMIPFRVALAAQSDGAADPKAMEIIGRMQTALLEDCETWEEVPPHIRREFERLEQEYCQAHEGAWWVRQVIIWEKPNPMPESVNDRCTTSHEYVLLMAKSKRYYYDAEAIREPATTSEWPGIGPQHGDIRDRGEKYEPMAVRTGRNKRSVWTIPTSPYSGPHYSTFPPALVEPMILAGSSLKVCAECGAPWERIVEREKQNVEYYPVGMASKQREVLDNEGKGRPFPYVSSGEKFSWATKTLGWRPTCSCNADTKPALVLDPFCGTATVAQKCIEYGRDYVMIDIDPKSIELAKERIAQVQVRLF